MVASIRVDRNLPMTTRDGIVLRADVYRPDDNQKHPAIVIRTPYDKSLSGSNDVLSAVQAAFAGYAVVIQDTRGRFASEGEFTPMMPEGLDGYDTVEWVAAETWCDGHVGMAGLSYPARIVWQTAVEAPPSLKAIAPAMWSVGTLSPTRMSGPVDLDRSISWFVGVAVDLVNKMEKQGRDVSQMRVMLNRARSNLAEVYDHLPLNAIPHFQFEGLAEAFTARMNGDLAGIGAEEDLHWAYHRVKVPCFQMSGWYDLFGASLFTNFVNMRRKGGSKQARESQHILCGPWAHGAYLSTYVGGLNFGPSAAGRAALVANRHLAFFDRYLKGMDRIHVDVVRYFVMGRNEWRNAETWPLPQTEWRRFFLHSKGRANTAAGNGLLGQDVPGPEPPDIFVYDPRFPVPSLGGRVLGSGVLVPGPLDQILVERRGDVLCYTTPVLEKEVEVTGPLVLHLFAATSARDTDFTAKLVDVYPDGSAYNVAAGCIRARYRKSLLLPELVNPGEVQEYAIDMGATSIVFGRGHRIRIDVSSSDFPSIDRNMNTGNPFGEDAQGVPAMQTVYHQADYQSYIELPVIPLTE